MIIIADNEASKSEETSYLARDQYSISSQYLTSETSKLTSGKKTNWRMKVRARLSERLYGLANTCLTGASSASPATPASASYSRLPAARRARAPRVRRVLARPCDSFTASAARTARQALHAALRSRRASQIARTPRQKAASVGCCLAWLGLTRSSCRPCRAWPSSLPLGLYSLPARCRDRFSLVPSLRSPGRCWLSCS